MLVRINWSVWIFILGIIVTFAGIALAIVIPYFLPIIQEIFYGAFVTGKMIQSLNPNDIHHINWIYGVLGGTMIGWGVVITMLAYQNIKNPQAWILNVILVSVISWYIVDTSISIYYQVIPNVILNSCILILTLIPTLLEKFEIRKS